MEYKIIHTKKFEKDIKNLRKQNKDLTELFDVVNSISKGKTLDEKYKDHKLVGNFNNYTKWY